MLQHVSTYITDLCLSSICVSPSHFAVMRAVNRTSVMLLIALDVWKNVL